MTSTIPSPALDGEIDRISPTQRPAQAVAGYHHWLNLLFIHWTLPAELVAPLLPRELTLDTWNGEAWVGLVPFYMSSVRPRWSPAIPGISYFCETNVRTYVHRNGRDPGVWFFSLEASNSIAVIAARCGWHLPYFRAQMQLERTGDQIRYSSHRKWPGPAGAGCQIEAEFGELLGAGDPDRPLSPGMALPGTLEHFLVERYVLYSRDRRGRLFSGRVYHRPYPVRQARLLHCEQTLLQASGINPCGSPSHVAASDGVEVEVFPLVPLR